MIDKLYPYRFHIFLFTQLAILFGALIFTNELFDDAISPILFIANLMAGLLMLRKKKKTVWLVGALLLLATLLSGLDISGKDRTHIINVLRLCTYFLFYLLVARELIIQVWRTRDIDDKAILGLISGFISLGLIGFFLCLTAEIFNPGSFSMPDNGVSLVQNLMYFSYITLLTIGYGDMAPVTVLAQKIAVLIGLAGQMYLVILTGIIVGKYINHKGPAPKA